MLAVMLPLSLVNKREKKVCTTASGLIRFYFATLTRAF